jgi:hypothetical protein
MSQENNNNEDYLNAYLKEQEQAPVKNSVKRVMSPDDNETDSTLTETQVGKSVRKKVESLEDNYGYINVDVENLPMGLFYPKGTQILIRPAKTVEIQAYSVVDENNMYDVTMKMNETLASCARLIWPSGKYGTYRDIKDGDRIFLMIEISRISIPSGKQLIKNVNCTSNSEHKFTIPLNKQTYVYSTPDQGVITSYFDEEKLAFVFELENGALIELGAPSIGVTTDLYAYIMDCVVKKRTPNVSFMKCIPWMLYDRSGITLEGCEKREDDFKKLDSEVFMFVDDAIDHLKFGIRQLKAQCPQCGTEVHTDFDFPNGARSLLVIRNAFGNFIKQ